MIAFEMWQQKELGEMIDSEINYANTDILYKLLF